MATPVCAAKETEPFPLMNLPAELRVRVYNEARPIRIELAVTHYQSRFGDEDTHIEVLNRKEWFGFYSLLRTSKLIRQETACLVEAAEENATILLDTKRYSALFEDAAASPDNMRGDAPPSVLPKWLYDVNSIEISSALLFRSFEWYSQPAYNLATLNLGFQRKIPGRDEEEWALSTQQWKTHYDEAINLGQMKALEDMIETTSEALACRGLEELNMFLGGDLGNALSELQLCEMQRGSAVVQQSLLSQPVTLMEIQESWSGPNLHTVAAAECMSNLYSVRAFKQFMQYSAFDIEVVDEEEQAWRDECQVKREKDEQEFDQWLLETPG